jgi:hypothetical protein
VRLFGVNNDLMKRMLNILFAFSVALASCQCAFATDNHDPQPQLEQECHDMEPMAALPVDCDCCDDQAVEKKSDRETGVATQALEGFSPLLVKVAAVQPLQRKRPPPLSTPISRGDRLLT